MSKKLWLAACIFIVIALAACQPQPAPTAVPTEAVQPEATSITEPNETQPAATPVPASVNNPYPGPAIEYVPYDPYPAPAQGEVIEWSKVPDLLASGNVAEVFQAYSLQVTIKMKDGTSYVVVEPAKNEIFNLLDQCGETCVGVRRISEWF